MNRLLYPINYSPENSHSTIELNLDLLDTQQKNPNNLSEFIDTVNLHNKQNNFKFRLTLSLFIIIILLSSGSYYFIKSKESHQNIYLSPSNAKFPLYKREAFNAQQAPLLKRHKELVYNNAENKILSEAAPSNAQPTKKIVTPKKNISQIIQSDIKIAHTKKPNPVNLLLNDAYLTFHKHNYHLSKQTYKKVLSLEPKNRNALVGLAAIATKQNNYELAHKKYQNLLRLNPQDSLALAGISSMKQLLNFPPNESQLKFMLKQQPHSAHLYFSLGSQYSAQQKWPEAQAAYFNAWSADNNNVDYSYNLAVSLDHLNQKKSALKFYQLSLNLDKNVVGNFSRQTIQNRIQVLQETTP